MREDSTCLRVVLQQLAHVTVVTFIYTKYKFRVFGYPKAKYGIRTRDTNLEGWDVTTTPISQRWEIALPALPSHKKKYKTSLKPCQATYPT